MLNVINFNKIYSNRSSEAIIAANDINLFVGRNEVVGLLGPNGAGKTTIIKSICGILTPTSGEIIIDGINLCKKRRDAMRKIAAVLEGNRNIYWQLTPKENLEFFAGLHGIPARRARDHSHQLITQFNLVDKINTPAQHLSRGMQQKLALATTLIKQTDLILLDEPTLGLDVETSYELRDHLKQLAKNDNRTILLSSHDMNVVQDVCDRVIIINHGRIIADDSVDRLLRSARSHAYEFVLEAISDRQEAMIRECFTITRLEREPHLTTMHVELVNGSQFYDCVDQMRHFECKIESVEKSRYNLEDVFLKKIRGES